MAEHSAVNRRVVSSSLTWGAMKETGFVYQANPVSFNEIRPCGGVKSARRQVKSLGGEIPLRGVMDGFPFTVSEANDFTRGQRPRISPRPKLRFHCCSLFLYMIH